MNNLKRILKIKKGMTLVEVVIAFSIALIIIGVTGSMLISGTNLFKKQSNFVFDQEIATTVTEFVTDELRFATSIKADTILTNPPPVVEGEGNIYISRDNSSTPTSRGVLFFKKPSEDTSATNLFGAGFYQNREISIRMQTIDAEQPKTIIIFVDVYYNNEKTATRKETIEIPNVPDSQQPSTVDVDEPTKTMIITYTKLDWE